MNFKSFYHVYEYHYNEILILFALFQIDVQKPLINLLHNMVSMGSLYGGDNLMFASQYKKVKKLYYF